MNYHSHAVHRSYGSGIQKDLAMTHAAVSDSMTLEKPP